MNLDAKQKWVAALRSGEFRQGLNRLQTGDDDDAYCCLGVACIVAEREGVDVRRWSVGRQRLRGADLRYQPDVLKWLAASASTLRCSELIDLNDNVRVSFEEIADYIEKELP